MDRHPTCICSTEYPSSDHELAPCCEPDMVQLDEDLILCGNSGHEEGCHQPQLALCECTGAQAEASA